MTSYDLNPQKARIFHSVALLKTRKLEEIQNLFLKTDQNFLKYPSSGPIPLNRMWTAWL